MVEHDGAWWSMMAHDGAWLMEADVGGVSQGCGVLSRLASHSRAHAGPWWPGHVRDSECSSAHGSHIPGGPAVKGPLARLLLVSSVRTTLSCTSRKGSLGRDPTRSVGFD